MMWLLRFSFFLLACVFFLLPFIGFENSHLLCVNLALIFLFDAIYQIQNGRSFIVQYYLHLIAMFFISMSLWTCVSILNVYFDMWQNNFFSWNVQELIKYQIAHGLLIPQTYIMLAVFLGKKNLKGSINAKIELIIGMVLFVLCLLIPDLGIFNYFCLFLILDALVYMQTSTNLLAQFKEKHYKNLLSFVYVALISGILWESYNYYDESWTYTFHLFAYFPIFGLPILGYLGYIPLIANFYLFYTLIKSCSQSKRLQF